MKKKSLIKGFTVIEMLLSMSILIGLLTVLTGLFSSIVDIQLESNAASSVEQDGKYILAKMTHDMQSAQSILSPAVSASSAATLQIVVNSVNYSYSLDGNGNLRLTNNNGTDNLNSIDSKISGLSFQRIGSGDSNDTVQVKFTVTSNTKRLSAGTYEVRSYQTTLGFQ